MARYIDADRLIKDIRDAVERIKPNERAKGIVEDTITLLQNEPTADVEEVKHGEWKEHPYFYHCNLCDKWLDIEQGTADMNYCHCGAKMDRQ